jgi:hypothetical protein
VNATLAHRLRRVVAHAPTCSQNSTRLPLPQLSTAQSPLVVRRRRRRRSSCSLSGYTPTTEVGSVRSHDATSSSYPVARARGEKRHDDDDDEDDDATAMRATSDDDDDDDDDDDGEEDDGSASSVA